MKRCYVAVAAVLCLTCGMFLYYSQKEQTQKTDDEDYGNKIAIYTKLSDEDTYVLSDFNTIASAVNAGYEYDHYSCTPSATFSYDTQANTFSLSTFSSTRCDLYFVKPNELTILSADFNAPVYTETINIFDITLSSPKTISSVYVSLGSPNNFGEADDWSNMGGVPGQWKYNVGNSVCEYMYGPIYLYVVTSDNVQSEVYIDNNVDFSRDLGDECLSPFDRYHSITVDVDGSGSATADPNKVEKGSYEPVTLTAVESDDSFVEWDIQGQYDEVDGDPTSPVYVIIPLSDLEVYAVFKEN